MYELVPGDPASNPAASLHLASTTVLRQGRNVTVCLSGEVDLVAAPDAWAAIEPVITPGDTVVFDMADVSFIDSSGINLLLRTLQAVAPAGTVSIHQANRQARQVLAVAGLDGVFDFEQ